MGLALDPGSSYRNRVEWLRGLLCGKDAPLHTTGTASMKAMLIRGLILTDLAPESASAGLVCYAILDRRRV